MLKLLQKHKTLAGELLAHRSLLQVHMCVFVYYVCVTSENRHLENVQVSFCLQHWQVYDWPYVWFFLRTNKNTFLLTKKL